MSGRRDRRCRPARLPPWRSSWLLLPWACWSCARPYDRLHYLGPAATLGPVLIVAAVLVRHSSAQACIKAVLISCGRAASSTRSSPTSRPAPPASARPDAATCGTVNGGRAA